MSQQNPIRVFVTHAWQDADDYQRLFEFLESARNFYYRNTSTPEQPPAGDTEAQREDLRRQIAAAEILIALPGLYARAAGPDHLPDELCQVAEEARAAAAAVWVTACP